MRRLIKRVEKQLKTRKASRTLYTKPPNYGVHRHPPQFSASKLRADTNGKNSGTTINIRNCASLMIRMLYQCANSWTVNTALRTNAAPGFSQPTTQHSHF